VRKIRGPALLAIAWWCAALATPLAATPFTYHDYDSMVADLQALAAAHPGLAELFTAQDAWGLPTIPDGGDELSVWVLRITNESTGLDKPEVGLVGVQHGNEVVSLEVCVELARLLLESYGVEPWLTELVDRREIYLVPLANPHGFRHDQRSSPGGEGFEDMNRDHPYDRCSGPFCEDDETLSTVGGQAIHELARRHLFRVLLDYHGGVEVILYPWGSPVHNSNTESPDDVAHDELGDRMSAYGGPFSGFYPVGRSSDILGPVNGPLDDTSYATSWDPGSADPSFPTLGWRALAYTVEISDQKRPPESSLGGDADLLTPGGAEDGYVPKNIRIGLAAIDVAEPYVLWTNRDSLPSSVGVGEPIDVEWQVRGCFEVDETRVRFGEDADPRTHFDGQTAAQSDTAGDPCFDTPTAFAAEVTFSSPGTFYLAPVARVDGNLLSQSDPNPDIASQSWIARARSEDGVLETNATDPTEVNTVQGQLFWGAEPVEVVVEADLIFADGFESGDTSAWSSSVP
jgi:hypothetical protein